MSGLYRVIDMRMWGDAKFRQLSDEAKLLWIYLITGPETLPVPGCIAAGKAGLAEALGWSPERFAERFRELSSKGMAKADWDARFVFLARGIEHRSPDNPNVVKGWVKHLDLIPECQLKTEAISCIYRHLLKRGKRFAEPFAKRFGEPLPEQEQEKEQEKEKEKERNTGTVGEDSPTAPDGGQMGELIPLEADPDRLTPERVVATWNELTGGRIREISGDRRAAIRRAIAIHPEPDFWRQVCTRAAELRALPDTGWLTLDWLVSRKSGRLNAERINAGEFDWKLARSSGRDIRTGYVHHGAAEEAAFGPSGDITHEF